jgi:tetratricopeptide (TPR) repeat protein
VIGSRPINLHQRLLFPPTLVVLVAVILGGGTIPQGRGAVFADVIVLKNGNEIHGEILREGQDRLVVKFSGGIIQVPRRRIETIERESRRSYLLELAETQMRRKSYEEALSTLEEAARVDPSSGRTISLLQEARQDFGLSLRELGRYQEAVEVFRLVLQGEPDHSGAKRHVREIDAILRQALREEENARRSLRSGADLDDTLGRLETLFDRFPDRRDQIGPMLALALGRRGDRRLGKRDLEGAEEDYTRAISINPDLAPKVRWQYTTIKIQKLDALARAGKYRDVEKESLQGLEVNPASPALRFYQALALESRGKTREAAERYLRIADVRRPPDLEGSVAELRRAAEKALVEAGTVNPSGSPHAGTTDSATFTQLPRRHFVVHHRNRTFAREVADVAEETYSRLFTMLGCREHLREKIQIYVYPTKAEYLKDSGMQSWSGGAHQLARIRGNLTEHRIYCHQDQPQLLGGILPHEVAHALLAHRVGYQRKIPLWANEGFAVYSEPQYVHRYYTRILRQEKARRNLIALRDVLTLPSYPEDKVDVFYGQSFGVAKFLIEQRGMPTYIRFLEELSNNQGSLESLLKIVYGFTSISALESRWMRWLE